MPMQRCHHRLGCRSGGERMFQQRSCGLGRRLEPPLAQRTSLLTQAQRPQPRRLQGTW
ncbi:hypothetical protein F442_15468 [Phytophthora nicotianae P10297]|uniref:Uncharacterized protein n=1 Tax=Phytophthora nicotianae P10297 TaxID=1317064 RepID=W2YP50_PHYNI|nr:hypothetical protein F442_15468 [Phytophthora nicotianae P10297]